MSIKKLAISLLVGGLFVISGCGGGGNGSLPDKPNASQMQKLNDSNADKSVKGSLESLKSSSSVSNDNIPGASLRIKNKLSKVARLSVDKTLRTQEESCDSGTAKLNTSSNTEGTLTYNQCSLNGTVYNGTVAIKVVLDSYGDAKELTATFNNLTMHNASADYNIEHAKLYINRDTKEISLSKMYTTFKENGSTEEYINFNISKKGDESNAVLTFKGYIKPKCLNGFVYVESLPSIQKDYGKFNIESNSNKVTVEYDNDTVTITKPSGEIETMSKDEFDSQLEAGCN